MEKVHLSNGSSITLEPKMAAIVRQRQAERAARNARIDRELQEVTLPDVVVNYNRRQAARAVRNARTCVNAPACKFEGTTVCSLCVNESDFLPA